MRALIDRRLTEQAFREVAATVEGATVEGAFEKVKRQGRYVFHNEVTAATVTCR